LQLVLGLGVCTVFPLFFSKVKDKVETQHQSGCLTPILRLLTLLFPS
jgi:hypothetical protein